jgi:Tfp pilus assembly protein PilO
MNLPTLATGAKVEKFDITKVILFAPPALAILASVLIAFFVVWPRFNDVLSLQKSNKTLRDNALALEQKATALESLDRSRLKSQLLAANQLVPSDKNIFNFIGQVEETRNSSGVAITNLSVGTVGQFGTAKPDASGAAPSPPPAGEVTDPSVTGAGEVQMKLSLTSDYRSFLQFLDGVYALPRVVIVKDLSFASADSQITTSMTINALWQELPTALAAVESPLLTLTKNQEELLAKIETSGTSTTQTIVPEVPKGRNDIFTPFGQ